MRVTGETESDEELLRRMAQRDGAALRVLVRRHGPALTRYLERTTDRSSVDDVLQETLLSAWRFAGTYRGDASVKSWLYTIARNAAFRARRRVREEPHVDDDLDTLGRRAGFGVEAPDRALAREEESAALDAAFAALDADDREMLILRDVEGLSGEESARVLGLSIAAMKSRLHRARLRLVAAMRDATEPQISERESHS